MSAPQKMKTSFRYVQLLTAIIALLAICLGFFFLYISVLIGEDKESKVWSLFLSTTGITLLISSSGALVSEFFLKKSMLSAVAEMYSLNQDVTRLGVNNIYNSLPNERISALISKSKLIHVFHAYGETWLKTHGMAIKEALSNGAKIYFYFFDTDFFIGEDLDRHYNTNPNNKVKDRIDRVVNSVKNLYDDVSKGTLVVKSVPRMPYPSAYVYDDVAFIIVSPISGKYYSMPILEFNSKGEIYKTLQQDFVKLDELSKNNVLLHCGKKQPKEKKKKDVNEKSSSNDFHQSN